MSSLTQFLGEGPTTQIVNYYSDGGVRAGTSMAASTVNGAKAELSGELEATTLKTLLTVTGGGRCSYLVAYPTDTTSQSVRMVVEVDGVTVFDATSNVASATAGHGIAAAGSGVGGWGQGDPIIFNASLVVKVASSETVTDKVAIAYVLNKR